MTEGGLIVTDTLYSDAQEERAYQLATGLLKGNEAHRPDGIICLNEPTSTGAARAMKEQQLAVGEIPMVGFDSSKEEIKFLEEGIFQAIVVQKPFNMGYLAIKTALEASEGKKVELRIDTGASVITKDTMYTKDNQKLLVPFVEHEGQ
ncbi:substrate-binding domain-containing protein [Paenibacillus hexagrammi]|uniref:substrate-binding domain-containing protein n=1 Tax=Paenibacillus hexagrammi TaxID=2908839 RepID=UPI0021A6FB9C|nr:substrate-binding domain-containing protein [Paenibacillus sp. YPD9-1]